MCIIAAEKYRNIYSRQYGDWGQVFIIGIGIHYGLGRSRDGIPVGTKFNVMS